MPATDGTPLMNSGPKLCALQVRQGIEVAWAIVVFGKMVMARNHEQHLGTHLIHDGRIPELHKRHRMSQSTHAVYA